MTVSALHLFFSRKNVQRLTVLCTSSVYLPWSRFFSFSLGFTSTNLTMKWHTTHACRQRITSLTFHLFDLTTLFDTCERSVGLWKEVTSTSPHDAFDNQALVDLLCMQSSAITCTPFVDLLYITQKWTITVLQYVTTALPSSPLK